MAKDRPDIFEVAKRAGVSIATVSRVQRGNGPVAPATRDRVNAAIQELGYRPNRFGVALAERRHNILGLVFPDLSGPYYSQIILGFEEAAVGRHQSVMILGTHQVNHSPELLFDLADRVDGLAIMGRTVGDDIITALDQAGIPLVLLARPPVGDAPAIRTENVATALALTTHLLTVHRHREIAFIGDPDGAPDVAERWRGFREAFRQVGLPAPVRRRQPNRRGFQQVDGYAAASRALDREPRPTALVCANDETALGAISAATARGIAIPAELAITGWDDIPMARLAAPPLTTVRQPIRELGGRTASVLLDRIAGQQPASVLLPTSLVIRASCGCPNHEADVLSV